MAEKNNFLKYLAYVQAIIVILTFLYAAVYSDGLFFYQRVFIITILVSGILGLRRDYMLELYQKKLKDEELIDFWTYYNYRFSINNISLNVIFRLIIIVPIYKNNIRSAERYRVLANTYTFIMYFIFICCGSVIITSS